METKKTLERKVRLASGVEMPVIGFGTFRGESGAPPGTIKAAVLEALKIGIRHIDTAYSYENEDEVGEAVRESGVPREELFITTKLANMFHRPEDVPIALDRSLKRLGLDYVDLFLIHFPHAYVPTGDYNTLREPSGKPVIDYPLSKNYIATWKAMENLVGTGKTRAIGISNFSMLKTKRILQECTIKPDVNQVELHPYLPQKELLEFSKRNGIHLTAHSPLGGSPVGVVAPYAGQPGPMEDSFVIALAQKYRVQPSQILLSWALQRGTSIVPKSIKPERILLNTQVLELEEEDFQSLENLLEITGKKPMRRNDPTGYIGFNIYNEEEEEPV